MAAALSLRRPFTTTNRPMRDSVLDFIGFTAGMIVFVAGSVGLVTLADYIISSQSVVDAINKQCGTQYERIDYLRVGPTTMRDLCRIKEQRVKLGN
jgi:hypothetical protein